RVDAQTDLDTALPRTSKIAPTHWVDRLVSFGRLTPAAFNASDYPWPAPAPRCAPLLTVSDAARAECAAWLERQGWRDRTLILVQPGNRRTMRGRRLRVLPADDKAWPLERWAGLLRRVHAPRSDFGGDGVRGVVCTGRGGQPPQDRSSARHCSVTVLRRKRGSGPVRGRPPLRQARMRSR